MPFAFELFLDSVTEQLIREVWRRYAELGISSYLAESDSRPHVTMAVFDELTIEECQVLLNDFVARKRLITLEMSHLGLFYSAKNVVYLGPTVTEELLQLHRDFHRIFERFMEHEWDCYRRGRWVPHCTLGVEIPKERLPEAVAAAMELIPLPLTCRVGEVGLIEFSPVRHLCSCKLG